MQAFELNLVGFILPVGFSTAVVLVLAWYRGFRVSRRSAFSYGVVFSAVTVTLVTLFWYAPNPSSLSLPESWAEFFVASAGLLYTAFFVRRRLITIGMAEAYAMGTLAAAATDAIRTLVLPLPVDVPVVYWGGSGLMDMDFQTGFGMASVS